MVLWIKTKSFLQIIKLKPWIFTNIVKNAPTVFKVQAREFMCDKVYKETPSSRAESVEMASIAKATRAPPPGNELNRLIATQIYCDYKYNGENCNANYKSF